MPKTIRQMLDETRLIDESDYASDRQIKAANAVYIDVLEARWPAEFDEASDFAKFCLKALEEEMADEALRILGDRADIVVE